MILTIDQKKGKLQPKAMTTALLHRIPISLPNGKPYLHDMDRLHKQKTEAEIALSNRNHATRMANVERIYDAIAASPKPLSFADLEIIAELSHTTIFNGIATLEDWEGGPRIRRIPGGQNKPHTFEAIRDSASLNAK